MKTLTLTVEKQENGRITNLKNSYPIEPFLEMDPKTAGEGFLALVHSLSQRIDSDQAAVAAAPTPAPSPAAEPGATPVAAASTAKPAPAGKKK